MHAHSIKINQLTLLRSGTMILPAQPNSHLCFAGQKTQIDHQGASFMQSYLNWPPGVLLEG